MPKLIKAYKKDFTIIDNQIFKDKHLSLKDFGLLCLMYSLPGDWDFSIVGLSAICKDGTASIRSSIEDLERYGYLTRKQARDQSGSFDGYDYYLYMDPKDNPDYPPKKGPPSSENPTTVKPSAVKPTSGKSKQERKQSVKKKEVNSSYNNNNTHLKDIDPSATVVEKNESFVNEKKSGKTIDPGRIINANEMEIMRLNEATRNAELSKRAIKLLCDACGDYGFENTEVINKLPDSDYKRLFQLAIDIANENPGTEKIISSRAVLKSQISKCIKAYQNNERN